MRIVEVNNEHILFDNGAEITFDHERDCCEDNYADFEQIEDEALYYNFDNSITFEAVENSGFRFGDDNRSFFIPCYSDQSGYYTSDIDIYFNDNVVLSFDCELV